MKRMSALGQVTYRKPIVALGPFLMSLALLFVYLFLVALYDSWTIPVAVLLSVPISLFGALATLRSVGLDNNIYAQIGLVLLIAMSAKTAILIVEFAMEQWQKHF